MRAGDLATQVAQQLQDEHVAAVINGEDLVDEEEPMRVEARKSIFAKIEFSWRSSDHRILDQIRAAADRTIGELFNEAVEIMDSLYQTVKVPDMNEHGIVKRDRNGRVVWQKDSSGREIEDWGRLTGQDLEKCLLDVARLKLVLAPQLNELLMEAVFAKHIADDAFSDHYAELVEGTIGDRNAYASRSSRTDKYHAYFRYYLWSQAHVFGRELADFTRIIERIRNWRVQEQR